jgi:hypothetical protein
MCICIMREIWVESGLELFYIWSEGGVGEFLDSLRRPLKEIPPPCFGEETPRQGICLMLSLVYTRVLPLRQTALYARAS